MRIKKCVISLLAISSMTLMAPVSSYAECEQSDMAGIWNLFYVGGSLTFQISRTGDLIKGSYTNLLSVMDDLRIPGGQL